MKRAEFVSYVLGIVKHCADAKEMELCLQEHGFEFLNSGCFKKAYHRPSDRYVVKIKKSWSADWNPNGFNPYDPLAGMERAARIRYVPMAFCSRALQIQAKVVPCKEQDFGYGAGKEKGGWFCDMYEVGDGHNGNHTHINGTKRQFDYED